VTDRKRRGALEVGLAADVGGEDGRGHAAGEGGHLVFQKPLREHRLKNRISARRAAAEVSVGDGGQRVAQVGEERFHAAFQFHTVLEGARGVEGYPLTKDEG